MTKRATHTLAVRRDLRRLAPADRSGGLAQLALTIAHLLDDVPMSTRDFAAYTRQFHEVMQSIGKLQEPAAVANPIDDLAERRLKRRAG